MLWPWAINEELITIKSKIIPYSLSNNHTFVGVLKWYRQELYTRNWPTFVQGEKLWFRHIIQIHLLWPSNLSLFNTTHNFPTSPIYVNYKKDGVVEREGQWSIQSFFIQRSKIILNLFLEDLFKPEGHWTPCTQRSSVGEWLKYVWKLVKER